MTDFEAARMFEQLEEWKRNRFGTPNQNFWAGLSEHKFAEFLTDYTGQEHATLGGNTEGFDVVNLVTDETYEVKHTRTTKNGYVFGGLKSKSADKAVFIKWHYEFTMMPEYCYIVDMNFVKENLNENCQRLFSSRLMDMRNLEGAPFEDLTKAFADYAINH